MHGSLNSPNAGFGISFTCKRVAPPGKMTLDIYPRNKKGHNPPDFPGCPGDALSILSGEIGT